MAAFSHRGLDIGGVPLKNISGAVEEGQLITKTNTTHTISDWKTVLDNEGTLAEE
jgi:hypothetical protein